MSKKNEKPKWEPDENLKDKEEIEAAEIEAAKEEKRQKAIESIEKEVVVDD